VAVVARKLGYVFQDLALFPHMSAQENIRFGLHGLAGDEQGQRVKEILTSMRIEQLAARKPKELSGGERQRVALARSLVTQPQVLLLDEPLAALDLPTKSKIIADLRQWNETHRIPILYVTHSREEVFALGERVIVVEAGKVLAQGTPHEVMTAPRQETIAQLAGFENIFDASVEAIHEVRGTMTCRLAESAVSLETPLVRAKIGDRLHVAVRAGDILLATEQPRGLSARNILPGTVKQVAQRDMIVFATVDCGVDIEVELTLSARDSLLLSEGRGVWVVIKTYSCHLMSAPLNK
jgi:molybdate transport system ATP-binding protein